MNVLKRIQASRYARKLQAANAAGSTDVTDARDQLLTFGSEAIRPIFETLAGQKPNPVALEVLERLLTDNTLPAYVEALKSSDAAVADASEHVLARASQYDPTPLLSLFSDPDVSNSRIERILAERMASLQPRVLIPLLPDLSREGRVSVFRLLEKRVDASIAPDVVRLASHTDWWLRQSAARLLAQLPGRESTDALAKLLRDEAAAVRLAAVRSLAALKDPGSIGALCTPLRDPDIKVQGAAIEALIEVGDMRAVAHLLDYLKDSSEYVRRAAVEVLNQVVTVDAIKDLVSALRDQDWWVRVRAADALGTLGGDRVVEAVIALLDDQDDFVRRYAVEILNTVTDGRAVEPLIRALEDADWWVRERAIDALAKVGDGRAVYPLLSLMAREMRLIPLCVRTLGAIGDERAVEPICRLAGSDNAEVRNVAVEALGLFDKRELSQDAREAINAVRESLGVAPGQSPLPRIEIRSSHGPEAGRHPTHADRPAPAGPGEPRQSPASPRGMYPGASGAGQGPPAIDFQSLDAGDLLADRWRVVRRIGGGGFGTVYLVQDVIVNEEMVLKVLSPHLSLDANMNKRFVHP